MIEVQDLHKRYGDVQALRGISFSVAEGEIFGLLGHNGAGKTTTIRIMTGRAKPTSGSVAITGVDVVTNLQAIKPRMNLVFEDQNLYERLSGRDNLTIFADLYEVPRERVHELLERIGLEEAAHRKVKTYSSGMKQRLLIARALLNDPDVLFLDEPTKGLDPYSSRSLRELIRWLADSGTTILLCTHYMEEADELCDRVAFLSSGEIVAVDTPRELKLRYGQRSAVVLLEDRHEVQVDLNSAADAEQLARWMEQGEVLTIHSEEGTLEDVFVSLAGRPL